ncbi:MAG: TauD/TfdA family dioxygenase [Saprospiraceae bacterium]|nr:TauD/TfdA family dioxygenase [Saprospiraceae bacterium]
MQQTLPPLQTGPTVWRGPDLAGREEEWITEFSPAEITELETAAEAFIASGEEIRRMRKRHFPLPTLSPLLATLRETLIHGIGFYVLRGLPVHRYTEREALTIFFGIGTHLGHARSQNAAGHLVGHVMNMGLRSEDGTVRIYQTNERQSFHTDSCDVVGLLCLQPASEGGLSLLVSADTVFNEMRAQRPDLLRVLLEPIATDRRGETPTGMLPYLLIPVFTYYEDRVTVFYQRQYIESAQRFPDAPRLTALHTEALDLFDSLCNSPDLNLSMMLEKGDLQFVYNHAMLHDRTAFLDGDRPDQRRHLARLWLSVPGDRPLPAIFATRFGSVEIGNRGGIVVADTQLHVPMSADLRPQT